MADFGTLLKELQDVESQLIGMRFGGDEQPPPQRPVLLRQNAMDNEESERLMRAARDIALDELSTEEEDEPDSDEEEEQRTHAQMVREEQIRLARIDMIARVQDILRPWAERRNVPRAAFERIIRTTEALLWRNANGSLEDYTNPDTLRVRIATIMRQRAERGERIRQGLGT